MELWIRSQDRKRIFKTTSLYISGENDEYYVGDSFIGHIGIYKTKERALEVLDEIQNYIEKQGTEELITNEVGIPIGGIHYGNVYQMPEE